MKKALKIIGVILLFIMSIVRIQQAKNEGKDSYMEGSREWRDRKDMLSSYDFFGEASHPFYKNLSKNQRSNRLLLRNLMLEAGFIPYAKEWWHFTLKKEPFPTTYFNFPIQ